MKRTLITRPPAPPKHLCTVARSTWKRVCDHLIAHGKLHDGDLTVVEAYASAFARLAALDAAIRQQPVLPDGKPHPCCAQSNVTASAVSKFGAMLGLGPVSRARNNSKEIEPEVDDPSDWGSVVRLPSKRRA